MIKKWYVLLFLIVSLVGSPSLSVADDWGPLSCSLDVHSHKFGYPSNKYSGVGQCWYQQMPQYKFPVKVFTFYKKTDQRLQIGVTAGTPYTPQANQSFDIALYSSATGKDCFLYDVPVTQGAVQNSENLPSYLIEATDFLKRFFSTARRDAWKQEYEDYKLLNTQYPPLVFSPDTDSVQSKADVVTRLLWPALEPNEGWKMTVVFERWDPDQGSNGKWVSGPYSYTEYDSYEDIKNNHLYIRAQKEFGMNPGKYRVTVRAIAQDGRQTPWSPKVEFSIKGELMIAPDFIAKKSVSSIIMSTPMIQKDTTQKAYGPPKIKMPYEGQVFDETHPSNNEMIPFHYRIAFPDPFDIIVRFRKYEIPQSTLPQLADQDPKPTGTWSTILEKTIPANQLTTQDSVDGSYTFTELLYMPRGSYKIDAYAQFSPTNTTTWGNAVKFNLGGDMIQLAPPDLTPADLSLRINENDQCELWAKIQNIGPLKYEDPLEWEVFKDGQWVGTWGTANNDFSIGSQHNRGSEVERRLASSAALPIGQFGLHKWKVRLVPQGYEGNKINNIKESILQCKALIPQIIPEKTIGSSADIGAIKEKSVPVLIQGARLSYRMGEQIVFIMPDGMESLPHVECFDGRLWSSKCPSGLNLKKVMKGNKVQYVLKAPKAGQYRLKVGKVVSKAVTITGGPQLRKPSKAKKPQLFSAPKISLNKKVFTVLAKVKLKVKTEKGAKVEYVLEKKTKGQYRRVKTLRSLSFALDEPGHYRVKVIDEGSGLEAIQTFEVKAKTTRKKEERKTRQSGAKVQRQSNTGMQTLR